MINNSSFIRRLSKPVYIFIAFLFVVALILSGIQVWVLLTWDISGYSSIPATNMGLPPADQNGAFLALNQPHNPKYVGDLVQLLATTEPGVVTPEAGAHLLSREIKGVLVQSDALSENAQYRVYLMDNGIPASQLPMSYTAVKAGTIMLIQPQSGQWMPGAYLVDIPSAGMFGGRDYYEFYVDPGN